MNQQGQSGEEGQRGERDAPEADHPEGFSDQAERGAGQPGDTQPAATFASLLDGLRTIDDTFHFKIEGGPHAGTLVPLQGVIPEMAVGLDAARENICFGGDVSLQCAVLRKDWDGVSIAPHEKSIIQVNGEGTYSWRLLRHGDRVELCVKTKRRADTPVMTFHEPVSLRVLPSLSSLRIPPPAPAQSPAAASDEGAPAEPPAGPLPADPRPRKIYLGLFRPSDMLLMLLLTLAGSVAVFFLLEWLERNV